MSRYSFSGHESFNCKSLWLKKGYDYLFTGNKFTAINAVVKLGVGKNMVSSIRFWLRVFGLSSSDNLTDLATFLFDDNNGRDRFSEDINSLWVLHYHLVKNNIASIYNLLFVDYQKEKREFSRDELQAYIKRKCSVPEQKNVYNENTIKKDISVLLTNYVAPKDLKNIENFSALLISLGLIQNKDSEIYKFKETMSDEIAPEIILYALSDIRGDDNTVSFDLLQKLSLIFCMPMGELISIILVLQQNYPDTLVYSDNSGIKNVQFLKNVDRFEILDQYYTKL